MVSGYRNVSQRIQRIDTHSRISKQTQWDNCIFQNILPLTQTTLDNKNPCSVLALFSSVSITVMTYGHGLLRSLIGHGKQVSTCIHHLAKAPKILVLQSVTILLYMTTLDVLISTYEMRTREKGPVDTLCNVWYYYNSWEGIVSSRQQAKEQTNDQGKDCHFR